MCEIIKLTVLYSVCITALEVLIQKLYLKALEICDQFDFSNFKNLCLSDIYYPNINYNTTKE